MNSPCSVLPDGRGLTVRLLAVILFLAQKNLLQRGFKGVHFVL